MTTLLLDKYTLYIIFALCIIYSFKLFTNYYLHFFSSSNICFFFKWINNIDIKLEC